LIHTRRILPLVACLLTICAASLADDKPREDLRPYGDGPLTTDDYRAKVPDSLPRRNGARLLAYTWTRIVYEYRYDASSRGGEVTATLSEFEVTASVDRAASWNARPEDRRLLDHEQGHFDLAQIAALQMLVAVERMRREGKLLAAEGRTKAEAANRLRLKIAEFVKKHETAAAEEHREYDRFTNYGLVGSAQAEARKSQREAIEKLAKELEKNENPLLNLR